METTNRHLMKTSSANACSCWILHCQVRLLDGRWNGRHPHKNESLLGLFGSQSLWKVGSFPRIDGAIWVHHKTSALGTESPSYCPPGRKNVLNSSRKNQTYIYPVKLVCLLKLVPYIYNIYIIYIYIYIIYIYNIIYIYIILCVYIYI